jgi:fumarylacetoacetate (FAA) hydrolase
VASIRDFYAFEQHVATCRRHRGLEMVPMVRGAGILLSNPAGVVHHETEIWALAGAKG